MIEQIIQLTNRRPAPVAKLCTRLGLSERELTRTISSARSKGFEIHVADGFVHTKPRLAAGEVITVGATKPGRYTVAHFTDLHAGSTHCDVKAAVNFLHEAKAKGASVVVCTGDLLDGKKDVLIRDQTHVGFDGQLRVLSQIFRSAPKFKAIVAIDGNHDGYHSEAAGFVSGKLVENEMRSHGIPWHFAGVCLGRTIVHGARWHLWHPHGGAGTRNAVRRVLNSRAESLEEPCDILAIGHFHKFVSLPIYPERVHGIAGGTFQLKKSEFANRISNGWDIGGVLVSYNLSTAGKVSEISAEFVPAK